MFIKLYSILAVYSFLEVSRKLEFGEYTQSVVK
jgi:hypothetical protein